MSKKYTFFLSALLIVAVLLPMAADARGLVPCGGKGEPVCDAGQFFQLMDKVIQYLLFIAIPISALAFAYAGWLYMTAGGDSGNVGRAKDMFWSIFWGFFWMLSGFLVIYTILNFLTGDSEYTKFLKP